MGERSKDRIHSFYTRETGLIQARDQEQVRVELAQLSDGYEELVAQCEAKHSRQHEELAVIYHGSAASGQGENYLAFGHLQLHGANASIAVLPSLTP